MSPGETARVLAGLAFAFLVLALVLGSNLLFIVASVLCVLRAEMYRQRDGPPERRPDRAVVADWIRARRARRTRARN